MSMQSTRKYYYWSYPLDYWSSIDCPGMPFQDVERTDALAAERAASKRADALAAEKAARERAAKQKVVIDVTGDCGNSGNSGNCKDGVAWRKKVEPEHKKFLGPWKQTWKRGDNEVHSLASI